MSAPAPQATWTHLLLFDGVCHFCDGAVQFVLKRDAAGLVRFASIQSDLGREIYRQHGLDPEHPDTMLFVTPQGVYRESDAGLEILGLLGGAWPLLKILKIIPRFIRDRVYRFIATHRYQWFGKKDQCTLPPPEWRQRFLG